MRQAPGVCPVCHLSLTDRNKQRSVVTRTTSRHHQRQQPHHLWAAIIHAGIKITSNYTNTKVISTKNNSTQATASAASHFPYPALLPLLTLSKLIYCLIVFITKPSHTQYNKQRRRHEASAANFHSILRGAGRKTCPNRLCVCMSGRGA